MISKSYTKSGSSCRVTFRVPTEDLEAEQVSVLGDFNDWDPESHPLKLRKNGTFSVTFSLEAGRPYRFRYLADGERWFNDEQADSTERNRFGTEDAVLEL